MGALGNSEHGVNCQCQHGVGERAGKETPESEAGACLVPVGLFCVLTAVPEILGL